MNDLIDVISKYPIRNQSVILLALYYADMTMPERVLSDFMPFEDDMYRLIECLMKKEADEKIGRINEILISDLKMVMGMQMEFVHGFDDLTNHGFDDLTNRSSETDDFGSLDPMGGLGSAALMKMLTSLLQEFHTMKEAEITAYLDDMEIAEGRVYFNAIEKLSDKHLNAAMEFLCNDMMRWMGEQMPVEEPKKKRGRKKKV